MTLTRRRFIRNLGTATTAVAAIAAASFNPTAKIFGQTQPRQSATADELFAVPPESLADPLNALARADFESYVNTFVQVQAGEKQIELRLVEARELKRAANESRAFRGESFSLLFEDTRRGRLAQDVYRVRHFAFGELSLLLVPVELKANLYEAIINRVGGK